eukprot:TRINITY_DN27545_c0_g3_i2.p1 TRINITY_DN27545_c0_g3~~TRINITY_DN27545_c0_g3_i2.p1  ORF type:complete len:240 (-),score=-11.74 TRINITY_DN27545_c0_g3_i2:312-1031(-)
MFTHHLVRCLSLISIFTFVIIQLNILNQYFTQVPILLQKAIFLRKKQYTTQFCIFKNDDSHLQQKHSHKNIHKQTNKSWQRKTKENYCQTNNDKNGQQSQIQLCLQLSQKPLIKDYTNVTNNRQKNITLVMQTINHTLYNEPDRTPTSFKEFACQIQLGRTFQESLYDNVFAKHYYCFYQIQLRTVKPTQATVLIIYAKKVHFSPINVQRIPLKWVKNILDLRAKNLSFLRETNFVVLI